MRVVFAGTPEAAVPTLDALATSRHDLVAVLTRPDAQVGRGRHVQASPVGSRAAELGLPAAKYRSARDPHLATWLREIDPDIVVVVAYGALLPDELLAIPVHGFVNVHFSVLPARRGAAPVQRAIMEGDPSTGVTVFQIVSELDAGPVYHSVESEIGPDETAGHLLERLSSLGARELIDTLDAIDAGVQPEPQPADGVTWAPKVTVDDVRIDWQWPASRIVNVVRGSNPAPGAWTTLDDVRFKVLRATPAEDAGLEPGEVRAGKRDLLAGTGAGTLRLDEVQAFGKKAMSGGDWARGADVTGARFV
ncbi:MAG TPA: methionyl-tRNA formyltransferase [Propionibacteriaceae bacterium]|nr:methionyl-tRNA formyltransferase [Propionibacteriaceae bacterium]